ncbi:hypothetical protein TNCV_15381 [Trichonephila clavipes]|nr:hypothetical protein TNCV_15381 [Trichonephila clavipes]
MQLIYELAAERLYRERYPHRDAPDRRMLAILYHNLSAHGSPKDLLLLCRYASALLRSQPLLPRVLMPLLTLPLSSKSLPSTSLRSHLEGKC